MNEVLIVENIRWIRVDESVLGEVREPICTSRMIAEAIKTD